MLVLDKKRIVVATLTGLVVVTIAAGLVYKLPNLKPPLPDSSTKPKVLETPVSLPQVTLETIFTPLSRTAVLPARDLRTILFTGDVLLARSVNFKIWQAGDPKLPFHRVADTLRAADLTFVDLENPLVESCPLTNEGMIFCGDLKNVLGLVDAGVDVVSLANNHTLNYGPKGLSETTALLRANGLTPIGFGEFVVKEVGGTRLTFLANDDVNAKIDPAQLEDQIAQALTRADFLVVYFHWGDEYTSLPNARQRQLAHLAIEAGANLVVGSHPHWIQAVEVYQNVPILYSLGNFIFDQEWSRKTKEGLAARCTFYRDKLVDIELLPVLIEDYSQPRWLEGEEKGKVLGELEEVSRKGWK